jgi:hypothetical protein
MGLSRCAWQPMARMSSLRHGLLGRAGGLEKAPSIDSHPRNRGNNCEERSDAGSFGPVAVVG